MIVVDEQDLFRTGLASLLSAEPDLDVVGQASGGRAAVRLATELAPDVVLMNLHMSDLTGPEATRDILARNPSIRVVALTAVADEFDVAAAMQAGASGFLAKETPVAGVAMAVRAAAQGVAWLSPGAAEVLLAHVRQDGPNSKPDTGPESRLSARELEVVRGVARGMDNAEIAAELGISPCTAKNHVSNILGKLGAASRLQVAVYAVRRGLA